MDYREKFKEQNETVLERFDLAMERINSILVEETVKAPYLEYFRTVADFILMIEDINEMNINNELSEKSEEWLKTMNKSLYNDILEENYIESYANPVFAVVTLGEEYGRMLSFLYTDIRNMIVYAFESRMLEITIYAELFIEIYNIFEENENPDPEKIRESLYWFISDYSDVTLAYRIREAVDYDLDFATNIIMKSNLSNLRYLYMYGEYISENEVKMASFLNSLSEEEISDIAKTYTEGYRMGFENSGKDLSIKTSVNIRYPIGFERVVREAIKQFEKMGLKPVIYRGTVNSINKNPKGLIGYYSTSPNKQFDYDHRYDNGIYLDKRLNERKLEVLKVTYEEYKELAAGMAGPACIEVFGEKAFSPVSKLETVKLDDKQQKLFTTYANASASIVNQYIKGEERSFTIIAYPLPEIAEDMIISDAYETIFRETIKINNLNQQIYEQVHQRIIDTLDKAEYVMVKGKDNNCTDMKVKLHHLDNPDKQTNFENCLADVNIPVGEVFTSPVLNGTNGVLNVSEVFIEELKFINLKITFKDGIISDYTCDNFLNEEDNKRYIKENLMQNHDTLPIGEFAIGTNTTAYVMANKYNIVRKLPILIVEKMGPHFAIGDTCYSFEEDNIVYNSDGKEIIAKENEFSSLRKTDIDKAYFNCHTDITIPYEEIAEITAVSSDGEEYMIIQNGRFILEGTEELNKPFKN